MINLIDWILNLFRHEDAARAFVAAPEQTLRDAGHPVDGGWEAWEHDGAHADDWPGSHHAAHPGFDHFA